MATHGPSFRFAAPRTKDHAYTAGPTSRLPTRNNTNNHIPLANPAAPAAPAAPSKSAPGASKSHRRNIPGTLKSPESHLMPSHVGERENASSTKAGARSGNTAAKASTSIPSSTVASSRIARLPYQPKTPESIECVITPTFPSAADSSSSPLEASPSKTLRRKPSVIGKFISARRNLASTNTNDGEAAATAAPANPPAQPAAYSHDQPFQVAQPRQLGPSFSGPSSRPATADADARGLNSTSTPVSELSTTPSLRHTESSGGFSRATSTTPTSQISWSPMISHSPHIGPGAWNSPRKSSRDAHLGTYHTSPSVPFPSANNLGHESFPINVREPVKPVPELAHLAHNSVQQGTAAQKPPKRPSRDNTPTLDTHDTFTPVVYSDLPPIRTDQHGRKGSTSTSPVSKTAKKEEQYQAIPMPSQTGQITSTIAGSSESLASESMQTNQAGSNRSTVSSQSTSNTGKSHSRFGFFSRKDKSKPAPTSDGTTKLVKKGPMAGTGHEGYGKYAPAGRNTNGTGATGSAQKPTGNTNVTQPASRIAKPAGATKATASSHENISPQLAPVYPRSSGASKGAEGAAPGIIPNDSSSSLAEEEIPINSTLSSPQTSNASYSSFEPFRTSAKTSGLPISASTSVSSRAASSRGRGSWGSTSRGPDRRASKENSRSAGRVEDDVKVPELPRGRRSLDAGSASDEAAGTKTKKSNWSIFSKSSEKPKTSQKWSLFQRSQSLPPSEEAQRSARKVDDTIPVPPRSVAHYEILDDASSANNHFDLKELNDLMEEANANHSEYQSDADDMQPGLALSRPTSKGKGAVYGETARILADRLELSPELHQERALQNSANHIPNSQRRTEALSQSESAKPRASRLAQVGRIPKVVSTRDIAAQKRSPGQSFSRPLAITQNRSAPALPDLSLMLTGSTASLTSQSLQDGQPESIISRTSTQDNDPATEGAAFQPRDISPEFFSMRNNSDYSYSSSSGNFYFPSAALTAVLPSVGSPASEDEVWQEYDELIDNVLTPVMSGSSAAGASKSKTREDYFSSENLATDVSTDEPTAQSEAAQPKLGDMASTLRPDLSPFVGTLRRSQIFSGFELPEISPATSSFDHDEEGDRTITLASKSGDSKTVLQPNDSQKEQSSSKSSSENSKPEAVADGKEGAEFMKLTPKSMANLRFAALMTSKWLSFGRVLFSPAHYDLVESADDRVLVIDGLGTDWSYFTALTYPNLTVYSFGPGSVQDPDRQAQGPWQPLANHRHFSHNDMASNFPFPKNFFAVVIFRFPAATSEMKMRMTLSECKRVLQPGGYLEVSSLDLDLTNMGNKARRAIRALKTKMQDISPEVCLKPASDNVESLMGRRGFENLSRCVLGVPAAGVISHSRTSSMDEQEMSFTKLIEDQTQAGDEVMTKMVAKVGRWWYLKTYEMMALPDGDVSHSIWNDEELLRECERNQTTFRLFICYAQKPTLTKRRTVSL